jgi:hypothetical protein
MIGAEERGELLPHHLVAVLRAAKLEARAQALLHALDVLLIVLAALRELLESLDDVVDVDVDFLRGARRVVRVCVAAMRPRCSECLILNVGVSTGERAKSAASAATFHMHLERYHYLRRLRF